jgi:hypothetical protein
MGWYVACLSDWALHQVEETVLVEHDERHRKEERTCRCRDRIRRERERRAAVERRRVERETQGTLW